MTATRQSWPSVPRTKANRQRRTPIVPQGWLPCTRCGHGVVRSFVTRPSPEARDASGTVPGASSWVVIEPTRGGLGR
jgi:hypothetical protein